MRRLRRLIWIFCISSVAIFGVGCSKTPSISFYPTWPTNPNLEEMSAKSGLKVSIENMVKTGVPGMAMIVRGKLPMGNLELRAISISEKGREDGVIMPIFTNDMPAGVLFAAERLMSGGVTFSNTDPQADIRGIHILALAHRENIATLFSALSLIIGGNDVANFGSEHSNGIHQAVDKPKQIKSLFTLGRYYIFIAKDGQEITGTEVEIVQ